MKFWKTQFFSITSQQGFLYNAKFPILKTNLRLTFSKIFEFMFCMYLMFLHFENFFSDFWGPQELKFKAKQPQILNFGFLTFKTRHWGDFWKNVLYLTVPLCCSKIALSQDLGVVYYCFLLKRGRWVWKWKATKVLWHLSAPFYCSWIAQSHSLTLKMVSIPHWQIFMKLLPLKEKAIFITRCISRVLTSRFCYL